MRASWLTAIAIPVAALLGSAAPARREGPTVAVVDLVRLIVSNRWAVDENKKNEEWFRQKSAELEALRNDGPDAMSKLRARLDALQPGSDEYVETELQLRRLGEQPKALQLVYENALDARVAQIFAQSYGRVARAIDAYAKERQIDLVLQYRSEAVPATSRAEVVGEIVRRTVVAWSSELDITEAVLTILDR